MCARYLVYFEAVLSNIVQIFNQGISLTLCVIHGWKTLDLRTNFILTQRLFGSFLKGSEFWGQCRTQTKAIYQSAFQASQWTNDGKSYSSLPIWNILLQLFYYVLYLKMYFSQTHRSINHYIFIFSNIHDILPSIGWKPL